MARWSFDLDPSAGAPRLEWDARTERPRSRAAHLAGLSATLQLLHIGSEPRPPGGLQAVQELPGAPRLVAGLTRRPARDLVLGKEGEQSALAESGLDWTVVGPPRLVYRDRTGCWLLGERAPGPTARPVAKADVALAMRALASTLQWVRPAPFLRAG